MPVSADKPDQAPLSESPSPDSGLGSSLLVEDGDTVARKQSGLKSLMKGLIMIASLVVIGTAARKLGLADTLSTSWLDHEVIGKGILGELIFIGLGAMASAIGVPRQLVAFGGGYAFGFGMGILISSLAQIIGCTVSFFYSRLLGRSLVRRLFAARIERLDTLLRGHPFSMTLLIRLLPVGSNLATNMGAGVSSVPAGRFLSGTLVGYLPQTVVFVLLGTGVQVDATAQIALSAVLFVVSGLIGVWLYRRMRTDVA